MKKFFYILFIVLLFSGMGRLYAQEHSTLKLDKGCKLLKAANVDNGLILLTGGENALSKSPDWKISYITPHLTTRYQAPITDAEVKSMSNNFLVVSPTGNNVYLIKHGPGNSQSIMRVDSAGFTTAFTLKDELEYDRVNVVFADDNYLYYVTKEPDPKALNKHAFPKLQFVRIAKDKSVSKIMLSLPEPEPYETEWSYFGHTDVVSYFVSRDLHDINYTEEKFRIAVVDHDGNLQDDFRIDFNLPKGVLLPGFNYCCNLGTYEVDNHNVKDEFGKNVRDPNTTSTSSSYYPCPEAYGNIMLDPLTNGFYIYGLAGFNSTNQKENKHPKSQKDLEPSEYYVNKYDQDGKEIWATEDKLIGIDDFYKSKAGFTARKIALHYGAEGNIRFQAFGEKNIATMELNPQTGKFISGYANTFSKLVNLDDLGLCHKAGEKSDLNQFLSKADKGEYEQFNFRMGNGNIVVRDFPKESKLELSSFGD